MPDQIEGAQVRRDNSEFHKLVELALPVEDIVLYDASGRPIVKDSVLRSAAEAELRRSFHERLDEWLDALPATRPDSVEQLAEKIAKAANHSEAKHTFDIVDGKLSLPHSFTVGQVKFKANIPLYRLAELVFGSWLAHKVIGKPKPASSRVNLATPEQIKLEGHSGWVGSAVFSPDGQRVVTASDDRTARIWNAGTGQLIVKLEGHSGRVGSAVFSPDGQRVVTASDDRTARIWNAGTGQLIVKLEGHLDVVTGAVFSPDGQRVVTASHDRTARIWNAGTGQLIVKLEGHSSAVNSGVFSSDGQRVVTASDDMTAIWHVGMRQLIAKTLRLEGHSCTVTDAVFSPNGQHMLTASSDRTAGIWNAATGQLIVKLEGHSSAVNSGVFSSDGQRVVTASLDCTARIWPLPVRD